MREHCSPSIIYFDYHANEERHRRKFAGIFRFAKAIGWRVAAVPPERSRPASVRGLLARHKPLGCIVECSGFDATPPPDVFGDTPVVWIDPLAPCGGASVVCDNAAVAKAAFRELSAGLPPCFAAVPSISMPCWSQERLDAFRAMCANAGGQCHIFDGIPWEDHGERIARLIAWISSLPSRCAVFAANDISARDITEAARLAYRHMPKQLTLCGVDGTPEDTAFYAPAPNVTSIQLDFELAGFLSARLLWDIVSGRHARPCSYGPLCVLRRESTRGFGRREARILEAVEIIRAEACDGLSAADLAARFPDCSRKHFERRFREAMGHSILDEINHVRLMKAKVLLASPSPSIGAIADYCGFGSERELRRRFSADTGLTMRQWRKDHVTLKICSKTSDFRQRSCV